MMPHRPLLMALVLASLTLSGCSIVSPMPLWELAKATGGWATMAMQSDSGTAVNTVYHAHAPFQSLCIEFNPASPTEDLLPALQIALRMHQIESRIYEAQGPGTDACPVWLRYSAQIDWDRRPTSDQYQAYLSAASLTLQSDQGRVLSSSQYAVDTVFGTSKWATTEDKLSPVVAALVTGMAPGKPRTPPKKDQS
jgi:hypothetical protein